MVTPGTFGAHGCSIICEASSKGRVAAKVVCPWIPPFSPTSLGDVVVPMFAQKLPTAVAPSVGLQAAKGATPNSTQLLWLVKPDQPSELTQGGSRRPVEFVTAVVLAVPFANPAASFAQSAEAQYTAPGTCRSAGRGIDS